MAYTVLNESLQVKGKLTLNNGQGSTAFFADTITQQIATDNSSDPTNSTAMAFNEYDKQGNAKQWGHSIMVSVEATDLGSGISTNDYLMYFDDVNNHYYLMKVITAETDRNSGFVTISGVNTAIYELGKQIINAETTFKQANLPTVVNSLYKNAPFSVVIQDDLATVIDYTVSTNTSLQAVLQDLQTKYDVDVDSWIELDESGNISDRIIYFGHIGQDNGELIRYGGAKGFENINAQELSDTIYTKLYVTGLTNDTDPTKGHIGSVNNGMEYIVDDNANGLQYAIGASQQQPVYLEGSITNTLLSEPQALLTWANAQMSIFNHPRFNYTVTPLHDQIVGIGDTIAVQDFHVKPEILVTSKVIQKSTSFASPETNTFVLGEFSSIFTENANKGAGVIQLIKKDITVVQEAADNARVAADEAHKQAVIAQEQAIHAQTSADGKTTTYTVDSVQDLPGNAVEGDLGWVKLSDGTHMYSYTDGKWVEKINPSMGADIDKKVSDVVIQAKSYTATAIEQNNVSQQEVMDDIAKSQADLAIKNGDFNNKAQAMADEALANAKANTATVAQETLNSANQNIAAAKSDLTDGLQKEVSDRNSAVSELDTKAQGYVGAAKSDVLETVNKEVTDRQNAVSALNTKAQDYANTAKTDALNTIAKEVTDRQNAVSALDTKATNAVNQAKSDITDTINAISVGGRNLLLGTNSNSGFYIGTGNGSYDTSYIPFDYGYKWNVKTISTSTNYSYIQNSGLRVSNFAPDTDYVLSFMINTNIDFSPGIYFMKGDATGLFITQIDRPKILATAGDQRVSIKLHTYTTISADIGQTLYINGFVNLNATITLWNLKIETGNKATDWTPAPEDVVLDYTTKDNQIKATITQYQTDNDGKVSKVQTDATTALGQVATKVSQTDYDTKTGDLTTKYTQVKQTADSQAADIVDIKATATSQASKINSISSDVDGTKQSISDIETTQDSQSDKINQITSDVNGTKQSITDIQTQDGKQDTRMGTIETSVSGVKSDFSTYKTDANGRISTAQATAQTAVDGLKTKVSQTDYNTKTGQLQTDLTTTTQTANQAKTDIVSIKQKDGEQDAKMNTIVSDANGTKQTVSDLQTAQGKQSGSISTLQQRADGFESTVEKVNNIAISGRNYLLGTTTANSTIGAAANNQGKALYKISLASLGELYKEFTKISNYFTLIFDWEYVGTNPSGSFIPQWNMPPYGFSASYTTISSDNTSGTYTLTKVIPTTWSGLTQVPYMGIRFDNVPTSGTVTISNMRLIVGNMSYVWTPAPEDLSSATAKAQLTADNAGLAISNYKTNADGRISQAQTDIKANATAITQKVSQTVYDQKTGDLSTKINDVKQTADSSAQTIADIKTADGKQDARMAEIENNASGLKSTVSNLSTEQGKQSGDISTLQQRANGFEATVTKVNNLSVGGRNLLYNSSGANSSPINRPSVRPIGGGSANSNSIISYNSDSITLTYNGNGTQEWYYAFAEAWQDFSRTNIEPNKQYTISIDVKGTAPGAVFRGNNLISKSFGINNEAWTRIAVTFVSTDSSGRFWLRLNASSTNGINGPFTTGQTLSFKNVQIETGTTPTDWTPAPEDVDSATAKAQLTADQATTALNAYKTNADGRITKAQSDITQTAKDVTTKVSQTDYNAKTGDLSTKVSTAQQTADNAVTTIGNYKTSNDNRVKATESKITANAEAITQKVSQTDYNQKTGELSGKISEVSQTAGRISQTVSDVKTKVDGLSVGGRNLLLDTATRTAVGPNGTNKTPDAFKWTLAGGLNIGDLYTAWGNNAPISLSFDWSITGTTIAGTFNPQWNSAPWGIGVAGAPGVTVSNINTSGHYTLSSTTQTGWSGSTANQFNLRTDNLQGTLTITNLKFEQGNLPTAWTPAPEDTDNKISTVSQTVHDITSIVSNPTTGLSTRVQTAEGALSKVQGTDIPALQNATFWQPYSSLNFNDYTKQGSFFFNTSAGKTNSPTTSNSWTYLIVEQGTADNSRIKQTAWYDGVAGIKITYVRTLNSGTWSAWYANDNDSVTTISQTNSDIKQEISDRKTGDSNTLQQGKNFTTSQISNSETGMKSFVNQTTSGLQIGVIKDDVSSLKSQVNWQQVTFDDMNYLNTTGNYLITGGKGSNSPFAPWFYITVDAPRTDRITQTVWKDSNSNLTYKRSLFGTTWSAWSQVVSSATLLNIFHDSWSLGTTTNDGITKQMVTGIMGQPDGTLILKGNSLILDGNTTVTGDFYAKGGNFHNLNASNIKVGTLDGYQVNIANVNVNNLVGDTITGFNFNVNKQMTIASGGIIQSDIIHMDKDSFTVRAPNINSHRLSSEKYKVSTTDGVFNIDSVAGAFSSDGNISVAVDDNTDPYKKGVFHSEYGGNNLMMSATGYTNGDLDEYLNMSSARLDYMYSKTGLLSDASQHTSIRANLIETTGTLNAFGVTQTPRVYSWPNLTLESIQQSVVLRAGGKVLLQARENGSVYLPNRQSGSGGTSLQIAGDGGIFMQSSSTKYKTDIQYDGDTSVGDKFLTLDPATWQDKFEYEQREQYRKNGIEPSRQIYMNDRRYYGLIAEDLVKAGLEEFVVRDEVTGEVNGLEYDKVAISLIPVVREQRNAINELRLEIEKLKEQK